MCSKGNYVFSKENKCEYCFGGFCFKILFLLVYVMDGLVFLWYL